MSDITSTIYAHTTIKSGLAVKRKFKSRRGSPLTVSKWWFVISGEENLLQQLQEEWPSIINSEGKWSLEPLLCFESDSEATSESSNHDILLPGAEAIQNQASELSTSNISARENHDSIRVAWRALALTLIPLLIPLPPTPPLHP